MKIEINHGEITTEVDNMSLNLLNYKVKIDREVELKMSTKFTIKVEACLVEYAYSLLGGRYGYGTFSDNIDLYNRLVDFRKSVGIGLGSQGDNSKIAIKDLISLLSDEDVRKLTDMMVKNIILKSTYSAAYDVVDNCVILSNGSGIIEGAITTIEPNIAQTAFKEVDDYPDYEIEEGLEILLKHSDEVKSKNDIFILRSAERRDMKRKMMEIFDDPNWDRHVHDIKELIKLYDDY